MDALFLVARVAFGLVFVLPGVDVHLVHRDRTVGMAKASGVPRPEVLVPLAGVTVIAGGLMVALGLWGDLGTLLLAGFSLAAAPTMHAFWRERDPMVSQSQLAHFMKNIGLAAGALAIFFAWNQLQGDAGLALTGPLFGPVEG